MRTIVIGVIALAASLFGSPVGAETFTREEANEHFIDAVRKSPNLRTPRDQAIAQCTLNAHFDEVFAGRSSIAQEVLVEGMTAAMKERGTQRMTRCMEEYDKTAAAPVSPVALAASSALEPGPAAAKEPIDTDAADSLSRCAALWGILATQAKKAGKEGTEAVYDLKIQRFMKAATLSLALQRFEEIKAGNGELLENKIKPYVLNKTKEETARYMALIESGEAGAIQDEAGTCVAMEEKVTEIVSLYDRSTGF